MNDSLAFRALSDDESRDAISKHHRSAAVRGDEHLRVLEIVVRDADELDEVRDLLVAAIPLLRTDRARMAELLSALLPQQAAVLGRGAAAQVRRNAELQHAISREFGLLSAADVAAGAESEATNTSATANRWRSAGKIFAVTVRGAVTYPGFQFDADGQPRSILASLLPILTSQLSGWELVGWLTAPRDEFAGARAVDVWTERPDAVTALAHAWFSVYDTQDV